MGKKQSSWHFPKNGGGSAAGFNDSSIDHFKGRRLSSLVRETIQNSIDARKTTSAPVVVDFQLVSLDSKGVEAITTLGDHLARAKETAQIQQDRLAIDFYCRAESLIEPTGKISFLCVHDSNTTGLTGPIQGPNGPWYALTKGSGLTQHTGPSLGSFGHGSKAPFASSGIRSIFYLSVIESSENQQEIRFQGKSILQSHLVGDSDEMTQGTGFFGDSKKCNPLINDEVPIWAIDLRNQRTKECGTSILIPATILTDASLDSIAVTAIANFFYAILKGVLEVQIGLNERLNSDNIVNKFNHYRSRLNEAFFEIDRELIVDAFQSIQTIINPSKKGEQQVTGFGRMDWYLRIDDQIDSRFVAVARGNGMLITRRAPELRRFTNLMPFDFFVCVTNGEGAEILRSAENPEHTNFEFDRIDDLNTRKNALKKYNIFQKAIREILSIHASYSTSDQILVDDLKDLFNEISEDLDTPGGSIERGKKMLIANGNYALKQRPIISSAPSSKDGPPDKLPGGGFQGGKKTKQSKGGPNPSDKGEVAIIGPSDFSVSNDKQAKAVPLYNIRLRPSKVNLKEATVFFETSLSGPASIRFSRVGELNNEPLAILFNGKRTTSFDAVLTKDTRMSLKVVFSDSNVDFAIEGEAYEIRA